MYVCMYVCLSVRSHISKTTRPDITKCNVRVTCSRDLVTLWWPCRMLCTSGFVDNGANRSESKMTRMFRSVRQVESPEAKYAVSDCIVQRVWLRRIQRERWFVVWCTVLAPCTNTSDLIRGDAVISDTLQQVRRKYETIPDREVCPGNSLLKSIVFSAGYAISCRHTEILIISYRPVHVEITSMRRYQVSAQLFYAGRDRKSYSGPDHGPSRPRGMKATAGPLYIYLHIAVFFWKDIKDYIRRTSNVHLYQVKRSNCRLRHQIPRILKDRKF